MKTNQQLIANGWKQQTCEFCRGTGQECDYGNGEDFYGPKECSNCGGGGSYWLTPKGRHIQYPGGPFC